MKAGLLIVDFQNDFCPGGTLAVKGAEKIVENLNRYIEIFSRKNLPIFASRDWHPADSKHFERFKGRWPVHCIQGTKGARFHPTLKLPSETIILSKGMDPDTDSYSAFDGLDAEKKAFDEILKSLGVRELYIGGLATDYCVKASAVDALDKGYKVNLLIDAIKGVDANTGDAIKAIEEMSSRGVKKTTIEKIRAL